MVSQVQPQEEKQERHRRTKFIISIDPSKIKSVHEIKSLRGTGEQAQPSTWRAEREHKDLWASAFLGGQVGEYKKRSKQISWCI